MNQKTLLKNEQQLIGSALSFQYLLHMVDRVAPTDHTILLSGPTGSGKEVIARQIHQRSPNRKYPFITLDCGAVPESLIESELFGYVKGAFTGAINNQSGYFKMTGKGTLFIDEIGELPLALQPKLLRIIENKTYSPVGSSKSFRFEGRIVTATHRDLHTMVQEGTFREDLYYRLAVIVLQLPSLIQRKEDIPQLVTYFSQQQPRQLTFTAAALDKLSQYTWPGNIRQLRNVINQIGIFSEQTSITETEVTPFLMTSNSHELSDDDLFDILMQFGQDNKFEAIEDFMINQSMQRANNNKTLAAQTLGIHRKTIERRSNIQHDMQQQVESLFKQAQQLEKQSKFNLAISLLQQCINIITKKNLDKSVRHLQYEIYLLLAASLRSLNGWNCQQAGSALKIALKISHDFDDPIALASLQFGIWTTQLLSLNLTQARETAQDMLSRARNITDPEPLENAYVALANTLFWLGDYEEALSALTQSNLLNKLNHADLAGTQGFNMRDLALTLEGVATFQIGSWSRTRSILTILTERANNESLDPFIRVVAYQGAAWLSCLFQEMDKLDHFSIMLGSLAQKHNFGFYRGIGQVFRGCYLGFMNNYTQAEQLITNGYKDYILPFGGPLFHSFQSLQLSEILLQSGKIEACKEEVSRMIKSVLEKKDRAYLSDLLCIQGQALFMQNDLVEAELALRHALSIAYTFNSVSARVKIATHFAYLLQKTKRTTQAIETLTLALQDLEPDPSYPVFINAKNLLNQLKDNGSIH